MCLLLRSAFADLPLTPVAEGGFSGVWDVITYGMMEKRTIIGLQDFQSTTQSGAGCSLETTTAPRKIYRTRGGDGIGHEDCFKDLLHDVMAS